jgi:hypothetical protein
MSGMRSILLTCLALGALRAENARVGFLLQSASDAPEAVVQAMERETLRAFQLPGISAEFIPPGAPDGSAVYERLVLVKLTGRCAPLRIQVDSARSVLGFTHVSDGKVLPFIEVGCEQVLAVMEPMVSNGTPFVSVEQFGRALGRVVAHEAYHVLASSSAHDDWGLSKAIFTGGDFRAREAKFSPDGVSRMSHNLFPSPSPRPEVARSYSSE